jgi:hypothetical protein
MCFEDLTSEEADELLRTSRKIINQGVVDWGRPLTMEWLDEFCEFPYQQLLMASTVMPQRFLLSYIAFQEKKISVLNDELSGDDL